MRDLTFAELDLETAEQLPARELMGGYSKCGCGGGGGGAWQDNHSNNGNTVGLIAIGVANGNLSGNNVNVF